MEDDQNGGDTSVDKSIVTDNSKLVNRLNFDKSASFIYTEKAEQDVTMDNINHQKTPNVFSKTPVGIQKHKAVFRKQA